VDGRERLRLYLQQRRDSGERELLLDSMSVDEVMRIVAGATPSPGPGDHPAPQAQLAGDWRSILAAAVSDSPVAPPVERRADLGRQPASATPAPPDHERGRPVPPAPTPPTASPMSGPTTAPAIRTRASGAVTKWPAGLTFGKSGIDLFGGPPSPYQSLEDVARAVASCTACPLYGTATHPVPGEGSATASLVCVGEAPGATEDETGRPFVGRAGQLLDKILAAIDLARENVFICNVLKHRPPGNRNPLPAEVTACTPFLVRQLELIRPRVILAFGSFAAQTLLETTQPIGKLRGAVHKYYGVPLIATYHPAALLRNPAWKRPTWEDVQYARRILDGTGV
jgi:uracil-DNA glycosylase